MTEPYEVDLEDVAVAYCGLDEDVSAKPPLHTRLLFQFYKWRTSVRWKHIYIPCLVLSVLIVVSVVTTVVVLNVLKNKPKVIKSANDLRDYRAITLEANSLRMLLVSDPNATESACAAAVAVGSFAEPDDLGGLAHFLEHMLFMGSGKYPDENHFETIVQTDGNGYTNAYTSDEVTDYYFSTRFKFHDIMDVFAQFFISPLLDRDSIIREVSAVNSEWQRELSSDAWTSWDIMRVLSNVKHPFHTFSTGSISTLNRTDIQDRLWDFYDRYYSANLITVAIIGNETLDTLQEWAEEIFTAIPNKEKTKPVFNQLPFPPGDKRYISRAIYYQPKSDKDSIKLIFPINISDYPNLSYLTYLMGYEGKGSLYQYLSTRGYVTSLMSAISTEAQNFVLVSVSCDLTEKGLTKPKDIVRALFQFVKRVKANGVNEQLWKENKQIDELKFKFKEKEDPATYASTISAHMARVTDPRDFLDPPSRRIYNQSLEERIMAHITPDNFNMYISSLKLSTEMANKYGPQLTQKETWYSTPYENLQIDEADITNWETVELNEDLYLPETNPFIPDDFNIKEYEGKALPVTVNATEVSDMTVWWYQDKEFNQPKLYMGCRIQPKPATPSVKNGLLSEMLSSTYLRETSESLYPAVSVDYDIGFLFDDFWIMTLSGFSDAEKVKKVIESGLDSLFQLDFDQNEEHFNATIREPIRKEYLNVKNWMPAQLSLRYARMIQDQYIFSYSENLAELDSLAQSDIRNLRDDFLKDISIDCSIMGNVIEQQSAEYSEILKNKLVTGAGSTIVKENRLDAFVHPIFKLPQNKTLVVRQKVENPEEPNSGVLSLFQIGPVESNGPYTDRLPYTRFVLATLLGLMMREPCFNYLRTQQQLGYVASCFEEEFKNIMVFNILVQGSREDAGAYVIAEQHDIFVDLQYNKFLEQSKSDAGLQLWADIKVALRKQIEEKPISLSEKNTQFNREIFSPTRDFVRREKKVAALEEITMDDFIEFYKRYLIGENRRKISSQVYGKNDEMPETVNDERNEELILDIQAYRSKLTETYTGDE
ncbi:uncharacterized protein LOC134818889 isoform X6 [Bolinopsis microptera]|uniref:uncharacterized protein LOC134818889 isoform X6 n=1 Tax=Bolinopsis microptera TaxID=2820187 RepID=UPI00307945C6